ncbi:MAG: hypothetical protein KOO62_06360 [candidate division Zixibacteria bacterium]|nr:hypothetical protein [candidate division Zixibacteria bacterium]
MKNRELAIVALLSISLIALELAWTRIFSAEFFYTFAFLILSIAILGLGLGALALRLFPSLGKTEKLGLTLSLTGLMTLIGPPAVFKLGLKFSALLSSWAMVGKLAVAIMLLGSAFFFGGIALASIFRKHHQQIPKLYMADLIGAGLAVPIIIMAMNGFGTPKASFLCALPVLVAAMIACRRWVKIIPVILGGVMFMTLGSAASMLERERPERAPVIYKHWDAMSKIKIFDYGPYARGLEIDNVANSPVYAFDGNWNRPDSEKYEFGIDVSYLIEQFDSCIFLSLGSGGGTDALQALMAGATEVHAVEVNPFINHMMLYGDSCGYILQYPQKDTATEEIAVADSASTDTTETDSAVVEVAEVDSVETDTIDYSVPLPIVTLSEFTSRLYHDPRITVVSEDARAYTRRHKNKFDVIYSLSSNTWAALASGSFALAESYLFTTEAFMDYWESLSDSGFMMMEHQFYMPRIVSEVKDALENLGVNDPLSHFAVYNLPQMRRNIMFISKRPLTDSIRYYAFGALTPEVYDQRHLLYPAPDSLQDSLINRIVLEGWQTVSEDRPIDLSPATDDRPFVAQMGLMKNFQFEGLDRILPYEFFGFPLAKLIIIVILLVVGILILPLNLLPYVVKGPHLKIAPWLYFFVIGLAFMMVEIILIQKYTLFIGTSIYAIITVLLALLLGGGIGSRFSKEVSNRVAFGGIFIWLILDVLVFGSLTNALGGLTPVPRMLVSILLIFPLGFFMGMPFPKAALRVGELVDWGFAVNGAASVIGATLVMLIAFNFGYAVSLLIAAVLYLVAYGLISLKEAWGE